MREHLSLDDHRKVAAEILGILDAHTRILEILNGKVPVRIIDQLLTNCGVDKATNRLRSDLEDEMFRRFRGATTDVYYPRERAESQEQAESPWPGGAGRGEKATA